MSENKIVIVTGMHRSGTSLFSNYLMKIGLNLGNDLVPPDTGNQFGYYEDLEMVNFHNHILKKNNLGYLFRHDPKIKLQRKDFKTAKNLTNTRNKKNLIWGWKDPRTCLFLDFWNQCIEQQIHYIFLFRDPYLVADSLIRRNTDPIIRRHNYLAFRNYIIYNKRIIKFIKSGNITHLIINIDLFVNDFENYDNIVKSFLGNVHSKVYLNDIFMPDSLKRKMDNKKPRLLSSPLRYIQSKRAEGIYNELKILGQNKQPIIIG